jgi:hypothetical protein
MFRVALTSTIIHLNPAGYKAMPELNSQSDLGKQTLDILRLVLFRPLFSARLRGLVTNPLVIHVKMFCRIRVIIGTALIRGNFDFCKAED